jgi:hypothetical protein
MYKYNQDIPQKGTFFFTRFLLKSTVTGKKWQVIITYIIQVFIALPITLIVDILILVIQVVIKIVKSILEDTKTLFFKAIYGLFISLVKPVAILLTVFIAILIIYSLYADLTVFQTLELFIVKLLLSKNHE